MVTELLGQAQRKPDRHPRLAQVSAWPAQAVEVLLEAEQWSDDVRLLEV
ncbi:hypothetical protein [Nonomuraea jabiensis]